MFSSSMVRRFFAMAVWSITPSRMINTGFPHKNARNRTECILHSEAASSSASSVKMGITPDKRGMPISCMGTAARSEIKMATTNSDGSNSPT